MSIVRMRRGTAGWSRAGRVQPDNIIIEQYVRIRRSTAGWSRAGRVQPGPDHLHHLRDHHPHQLQGDPPGHPYRTRHQGEFSA
jgi:hypothetical protein